jgi:VWFA-related protein
MAGRQERDLTTETQRINKKPSVNSVPLWLNKQRVLLGLLAVLALLPLLAMPVTAQGQGLFLIVNRVDDSDFPQVRVWATISDGAGRAVTDLDAADFLAWEDGSPAQVVSASPVPRDEAEGITLVLALDVSGSMAGEPLESTKEAAEALLQVLRDKDRAALITFSEKVERVQPFTSDVERLRTAIAGLAPAGDTAFNDAVFDAVEMLEQLPPGRKAIVILTDGEDTASLVTVDDAINKARDAGVPVYAIGFGRAAQSQELENVLQRVAKVTGGHYYQALTAEELGDTFRDVADLLGYQYEVVVRSALPAQDARHELKLRASQRGQDADDVASFTSRRRGVVVTLATEPEGDTFGGEISLIAVVEKSPAAIEMVQFLVDDAPLAKLAEEPFVYEWDSATVAPGEHAVKAIATDRAGNSGTAEMTLTVVAPLTVKIVSPAQEAAVSGEFEVEAVVEAAPHNRVTAVEFLWDGQPLAEAGSPPYVYTIDSGRYVAGKHRLAVRARDAFGHEQEATVTVNVRAVSSRPGLWILLGVVLIVFGITIPLALRGRRRMLSAPVAAQPVEAGAWLVVERGSHPGEQFPLDKDEVSLGRSRAENDVKIEGRTASRRQSVVKFDGEQFVYFDLSPTNPSIINEVEIVGPHELAEGDLIEIGDMILRFTREEK